MLTKNSFLEEINKHRAALRSACLEFNVDFREVVTDQIAEKYLADFLTERAHANP